MKDTLDGIAVVLSNVNQKPQVFFVFFCIFFCMKSFAVVVEVFAFPVTNETFAALCFENASTVHVHAGLPREHC